MRILMLAQFYPPTIGGEERHVRNLAIALAERGHDVSVATLQHDDAPSQEIDGGVRVHRVRGTMQRAGVLFSDGGRQFAPPFSDPELTHALHEIILAERPDILHAHNWIVHSVTPLKLLCKAKLVVTLHDYSLVCVKKRLTIKDAPCTGPALNKCLSCATQFYGTSKGAPTVVTNWLWGQLEKHTVDMFVPVSNAVAQGTRLVEASVPHEVIPNFVPDNIGSSANENDPRLAQLPDGDFMLFVGDVKRDKGVGVLLQAYAALQSPVPLVIIGRQCNDIDVSIPPNVHILPGWPHGAVMAAWKRCLFAIVPSIWHDPCPTVAMEAMAMGRPVIAASMGGLVDIVEDGKSGLLVPPNDVVALRNAMHTLLTDRERRLSMGAVARQRVTLFQAGSVVPRIERIYQEVVSR